MLAFSLAERTNNSVAIKGSCPINNWIPTLSPPSRSRTYDPLLKRELLYQLSYGRTQCTNSSREIFNASGGPLAKFPAEAKQLALAQLSYGRIFNAIIIT